VRLGKGIAGEGLYLPPDLIRDLVRVPFGLAIDEELKTSQVLKPVRFGLIV
jgi:hypothetical protein